jgi:hypothetical protein
MYKRTDDGKVIDPPIIKSYERDIYDAMERADTAEIQRLTVEYDEERTALADKQDARERQREQDQALKDADLRDAIRAQNAPAPAAPAPVTPEGVTE